MYGPVRPLPYAVFRERLAVFSVIESEHEQDAPGGPCKILLAFRMGLSTGLYYSLPSEYDSEIVPEPEIISVLDYFQIDHDEFMDGCPLSH